MKADPALAKRAAAFTPAPPISLGLRRHQGGPWLGGPDPLGISGLYARQMDEKNRLLDSRLQQVFALQEQAESAAIEAARLVQEMAYNPDRENPPTDPSTSRATDPATDPSTGPSTGGATGGASVAASDQFLSACRLIPEDILLVVPENNTAQNQTEWRLYGGVLTFPGHWYLQEKIGKTLTELHQPVPEYPEKLARHVDQFFTHMQPAHLSWRQNWSVQTDDRLFAPDREMFCADKLAPETAPQNIFMRVETQHFYKLPTSGAVIFAIRTSLAPLSFWRDNPVPIAALVQQIDQLSEKMRNYKAIDRLRPALHHWLHSLPD